MQLFFAVRGLCTKLLRICFHMTGHLGEIPDVHEIFLQWAPESYTRYIKTSFFCGVTSGVEIVIRIYRNELWFIHNIFPCFSKDFCDCVSNDIVPEDSVTPCFTHQ